MKNLNKDEIQNISTAIETLPLSKNFSDITTKQKQNFWEEQQNQILSKDYTPIIENLPGRYKNVTFENFDAYSEELKENVNKCKNWLKSKSWVLILSGMSGTGKNHLAVSIAKSMKKIFIHCIREDGGDYGKGYINYFTAPKILYLPFTTFLNSMNDAQSSGDKEKIINTYVKQYHLILLNDLEIEDLSPTVKRNLYSLIDGVYEGNKARLIITTNSTFNELKKYDERIYDRMLENGVGVTFIGESYRSKQLIYERLQYQNN